MQNWGAMIKRLYVLVYALDMVRMNHEVAAAQMVHTYNDLCRGDVPNDLAPDMCNVYITKSVNHTQPSN
jgi:hypothetical protein